MSEVKTAKSHTHERLRNYYYTEHFTFQAFIFGLFRPLVADVQV